MVASADVRVLYLVAVAVHEPAFRYFGLDEGNGCFWALCITNEDGNARHLGAVAVAAGSVREVEGAAIYPRDFSVAGRVVALTASDGHFFFVHESLFFVLVSPC